MADEAPRILAGRYEVGELIGRGGMAEVHIGHDTRLGRTVAIKVLRSDLARDPSFLARFRREAQAAAALNHPAIVAVYDTGEDAVTEANGSLSHVPFIVMEYVEGHTVRDILQDGAAVPIDEAVEITIGVLSALEYSHHAGIIHRDIKPANVMLTPTGAVKVMDFGIARAMADAAGSITQTQAVIGTAQYLSPEQARGETVDARSDLYSTGCLLFELLTGRPPFVGDSAVAVAYQHVREAAPRPSLYAADVPEVLDRITVKSLAKEREARYGSAAEFRADLESAARGGSVGAPAIVAGAAVASAAPAVPASNATQVMAPATTTAATQVVSGAPGWAPIGALGTPGAGVPADDYESPRRRGLMWGLIALGVAAVAGIVLMIALNGSNAPKAPITYTLAELTGMPELQAKQLLQDNKLEYARQQEPSDTIAKGSVTRTDPKAGAVLKAGDTVKVWISTGKASFKLDDLSGYSQDSARSYLSQHKLTLGSFTTVNDPRIPKDKVVKTDPPAGDTVSPGDKITLFTSSGNVELPNLVGKTKDQAIAVLDALALPYGLLNETRGDVPADQVVLQDRDAGLVSQGSRVTLTIAVAPPAPTTVVVPDEKNKPKDQAMNDLTALGLVPTAVDETSPDGVPAGKVQRTDPATGSTVNTGSPITVYVSTGP